MSPVGTPSPLPVLYVDEPSWWRTVAWPQVITVAGMSLAVLAPIVIGLVLATA